MEKLLRVAEMRDLEKKVAKGEITYSRMVEIINEKHFMALVNLRYELKPKTIKKRLPDPRGENPPKHHSMD
jgi:hypothetical protein